MKVCILTNILAPYRIKLFEELQRRVDALTVLLMADRHRNRDWVIPEHRFATQVLPGIHIHVPGYQEPVHINTGTFAALDRLDPDVVISGGFTVANLVAFYYCKRRGRRYVSWGELTLLDGAQRSIARRWIRRLLISGSDACIASSSVALRAFAHYGANASRNLLSVMPIEVDFFRRTAAEFCGTRAYLELAATYPRPVLISVGRLTDIKGHAELFAAYEVLLRRHPTATLLLVGDGPQRAAYEDLVRQRGWSRVYFLGFRQPQELVQLLSVADVFVFHTRRDTFGAVLSEAMAARTLCVSSIHAAATHDLIADRVSGFVVDPRDTRQMTDAILAAIELSPAQREAMLDAAERSVAAWTFERCAADIVALLSQPSTRRAAARRLRLSDRERA